MIPNQNDPLVSKEKCSSDVSDVFVISDDDKDEVNMVDDSMVLEKTTDMTRERESIDIEKQPSSIKAKPELIEVKPHLPVGMSNAMSWIPEPDNPNFDSEFVDHIYRVITK